jgi:predicted O-linked N-acetylglucosamine transferase (SPINDLY family)
MKSGRKNARRHGNQLPPKHPATSYPASVDLLLKEAMAQHNAGHLPEAESLYRQILRVNPFHADALRLLGVIACQAGESAKALDLLDRAIQIDPQFAEAYFDRGNALFVLQQLPAAVQSYDKAIQLKPEYAEAYNNRGSSLHELQQFQAAGDSFDKAISLKPDFAEASSNRTNNLQDLMLYQATLKFYEKAMLLDPKYEFLKETGAFDSVANQVAQIVMIADKSQRKAALDALPLDLQNHPAVCNLRNLNFFKTESSGKDLVFFCFPTDEIWGPRMAGTNGIGGSEEAVIWLSRLLYQRGWNVTVYAYSGAHEEDFEGVVWKPYWMWNYRDKQDVTVIWRYPYFTKFPINSNKVIVDLHDVTAAREFTSDRLQRIHKIFVKSKFHRSLLPQIPDRKFVIIPNGIDAELFEHMGTRDPLLLINTSSAERSLETFLDCFEEIGKQVPNAKAQWAYGWGVSDANNSTNAQSMEWKTRMQERMEQLGVEECGRIGHDQVARLYREANIFAYPSEFPEIDCISLSKAMAAGAIPITTDFAAMGEKSHPGGVFIHSQKTNADYAQPDQINFGMTDPEQKEQFIRETVKLLRNPPDESTRESMRNWARTTFDWRKVADSWDAALTSQTADTVPAPAGTAAQENPEEAIFAFNRGNELYLAQQYHAAIECYDRAILLNPRYAEAYCNRGIIQYLLHHVQASRESCAKAILLNPEFAEAYFNQGNALNALNQYQAALESYDKAIQLKPEYAAAYYNRGTILQAFGQYDEALRSYDKAIQLTPDQAPAYNNRGVALLSLQRYEAAVQSFDKAILLNPRYAEAHNNRGNALQSLGRSQEALPGFDKAILFNPDYADAHCNRANTLLALKNYPEALQSYDSALRLRPGYEYLSGARIYMKRFLCDWAGIENECHQLEAAVVRGERVVMPFQMLAISASPAIQRQAAEIYARDKTPAPSTTPVFRRPKRDRIRIGYFSADYYKHVTSYLIAELFERHDRSRFEILGFAFGPDIVDEMTQRISTAMDSFIDVRSMRDPEVAELSRKLEVDIAVDVNGFTTNSRPGIFAQRAAPIQVNYLAYPGTMGALYMDYLIADHTLIPQAAQCHYSEKIVYMPDSYQVNDSRRAISPIPCARFQEGLPETAFVFCCFNNIYKISPDSSDTWMRILTRVQGSVLWLLEDSPSAVENLRKRAALRGIDPQRLVFAKRMPVDQHLTRQGLADLVLDTLPYNAHTTASDALWVGLPVLTRIGDSFAGRVAASLLRAVGLPELITSTESEYEELAVELAHNPQRLHALRLHLQQHRPTAPLFDCQTYTRHLESAYTAIYDRYHTGLPPDHIYIPR